MNRVLRLTTDAGRAGYGLENQEKLSALLHQHFPTKYQTLFAVAETQSDGAVIWTSSLQGHPLPLSSAEGTDAQKYTRLLAERLNEIHIQAGKLRDKNIITEQEHQLLEKAAVLPDTESVYIINHQPVITWWPRTTPLPAAPVAPVIPVIPAATAVVTTGRKRWLSLLLLLLLLLLAGGTFLWMKGCNDSGSLTPVPPPLPVPVEVIPPVKEPVQSVEDPVPPVEELPAIEPAPVPVELTPLEQCLREKIHVSGLSEADAGQACQLLLSPPPPVKIVKPAVPIRKVCPANRKPEDSPQVFIIFDASYSMILNMNLTRNQLNMLSNGVAPTYGFDAEPRRISVAKNAVSDIIKRIPQDMGITLVVASDCEKINSTGNITASGRPELLRMIKRIEPDDGTPLADAIYRVNKSIKNNKRDTVIILISDGEESCGKNPCAAAANLKRAHPKAVINVIDILGTGAGNCVAKNTGGKVFTANNASDVARKLKEAMNDYIPEGCN